jgi:hypothetical protein
MDPIAEFEKRLTSNQRSAFHKLKSPASIQEYLDGLPYVAEELDRSPRRVLADGQAHCLDGGLLAALAFWRLGFPPLLIDLVPEPGADDDHVLAVFKVNGRWGATAKSNYTNLRSREPVYRSLRELAMSYFEHYYNLERQKTLRAYTRPFNLARFKDFSWTWDEEAVNRITRQFYALKPIPLISPENAALLSPADERSYKAGTAGTDFKWVYGAR